MSSSAAGSRLECAPKPPSFLDPLYNPDDCYYYAVPGFSEANHPSTSWLLHRIVADDVESLRRKLEHSPKFFRHRYFQVLDDPAVYLGDRPAGVSMFHKKCLLYLTPLGLCLYFKSLDATNLLLNFRTPTNEPVAHPEEPQFASHVQDTTDGDFHAFLPSIIVMRREFFDATTTLQLNGWRPNQPIALPLRRRFERSVMYYRDWLDAAIAQLSCHPVYPIASLVLCITACQLYSFSRLPLEAVKPSMNAAAARSKKVKGQQPATGKPSDRGGGPGGKTKRGGPVEDSAMYRQHGLIPVDSRPLSVPLVGVKSLLELCQAFDVQRRTRQRAGEVRDLFREARAAGLNTEVLLMQAEECIAGEPTDDNESNYFSRNNSNKSTDSSSSNSSTSGHDRRNSNSSNSTNSINNSNNCSEAGSQGLGSNNHARKAAGQSPEELEHCSEPLRVLVFALTKDKSGVRLQQCLDAVGAYVRRNYFNCTEELPADHARSRDTRNVVTCLLNLISRELLAIDVIVERIRIGDKRRRALENRKQSHTSTITKVSGLMTSVLLRSKQIVDFLAVKSFPPYPADSVDFQVHRRATSAMTTIRYGVVRDMNGCKDSWKYLTKDMLAQVVKDSAILLHFKVGRRPTEAEMNEYRARLDRTLKANKSKA